MMHAFSWVPPPYRLVLLGACLAGAIVFMVVLTKQGRALRNDVAREGVVSFELAWSRSCAEAIIGSWRERGLESTARRQICIDFGFLALYPLVLSLGCAMLAEASTVSLPAVGIFISWAVLLAGPLDATENIALLRMLSNGASTAWAQTAAWCASVKFLLVFSALGFLVLQGLGALASWLSG
jgi:hypothetical protein